MTDPPKAAECNTEAEATAGMDFLATLNIFKFSRLNV